MDLKELEALFDECEEYGKFDRIEYPCSKRPDLHAFMLLNALVPGKTDMVCAAEHDQIWLEVSPEKLAEVATKEHIIDLIRCGVQLSGEDLFMFV